MTKMEERNGMRDGEAEAVPVKNKDIPLLCDVLCVMQEIQALERRIEWQHDRMLNITQHLTGMPGAKGGARGIDDTLALISEMQDEQKAMCREYVHTLKRAQKILNGIPSRSMRVFVMMKYVMNASDADIRREINMTRRGIERAKRCVEEAGRMSEVKWRERFILDYKNDDNVLK